MTKKILFVVLLIAILIIGVVFTSNRSQGRDIKIGAIMSLTGDFGAVGENTLKGMKVAQSVYNEKTGSSVELVIEDDGGDGTRGD